MRGGCGNSYVFLKPKDVKVYSEKVRKSSIDHTVITRFMLLFLLLKAEFLLCKTSDQGSRQQG